MKASRIAVTRWAAAACMAAMAMLLSGCIGIYNNTSLFAITPDKGLQESEVIKRYGAPSYATDVNDQQMYVYKVRNNGYYVLVGIYSGYDLILTCKNGQVADVSRVERPSALAILNPVPWADTE